MAGCVRHNGVKLGGLRPECNLCPGTGLLPMSWHRAGSLRYARAVRRPPTAPASRRRVERPTRPLSAATCRRPNSGSARAPRVPPRAPRRRPLSAGFPPAVSPACAAPVAAGGPTSSRQGVELPVAFGFARGLRIGNPRYGRLEARCQDMGNSGVHRHGLQSQSWIWGFLRSCRGKRVRCWRRGGAGFKPRCARFNRWLNCATKPA